MLRERFVDDVQSWLAKYEPVEREILEARARRLDNAERRRQNHARQFGDLCEATEGLAVRWRRDGTSIEEQFKWAGDDIWTKLCLLRYHRNEATRRIDRVRHALKRPLYYAAENQRRRLAAIERRRIRRRTTENPCPTREVILEAWIHRRDSHAAAIRFGSLIEDLECYLDNSLRFNESGTIVGRNGGVKRWLQEQIPALYLRYTTVMRFKAASRKLRQIAGVSDPVSAVRIIGEGKDAVTQENGEPDKEGNSLTTPKSSGWEITLMKSLRSVQPLPVVRARAIWGEITKNVANNSTSLFKRLDALLDPERIDDANLLASWRRKYENEITIRTENRWWRRLVLGTSPGRAPY